MPYSRCRLPPPPCHEKVSLLRVPARGHAKGDGRPRQGKFLLPRTTPTRPTWVMQRQSRAGQSRPSSSLMRCGARFISPKSHYFQPPALATFWHQIGAHILLPASAVPPSVVRSSCPESPRDNY